MGGSVTTSEIDAFPEDALLCNPKTWNHLLIAEPHPEFN
jgi:hypothetical protein